MAVRQPLLTPAREEDAKVASEVDLALLRSSSTKARSVAVIFGPERPFHAVMCSWHHGIQFLQAIEPMRRIFELIATSRAAVDRSGVVAGVTRGGRDCSSSKSTGGKAKGPDCFSV
jgi:hypothetical protein